MDGNEGKRRPVLHLGSANQRVTLSDLTAVATDQADLAIEDVALDAFPNTPKVCIISLENGCDPGRWDVYHHDDMQTEPSA